MRSCTVSYIDLNTVKEHHSSGSGLGCSPALGKLDQASFGSI